MVRGGPLAAVGASGGGEKREAIWKTGVGENGKQRRRRAACVRQSAAIRADACGRSGGASLARNRDRCADGWQSLGGRRGR